MKEKVILSLVISFCTIGAFCAGSYVTWKGVNSGENGAYVDLATLNHLASANSNFLYEAHHNDLEDQENLILYFQMLGSEYEDAYKKIAYMKLQSGKDNLESLIEFEGATDFHKRKAKDLLTETNKLITSYSTIGQQSWPGPPQATLAPAGE